MGRESVNLVARVVHRYKIATSEGPLADWLDDAPQLLAATAKSLAIHEEIEKKLTEFQAFVESPDLAKHIKGLQKALAKLRTLPEIERDLFARLKELDQTFVQAVAQKKTSLKAEAAPLLADCKRLDNTLSHASDWLPFHGDLEDMNNGLGSRKLAAIHRMYERAPDLEDVNIFGDIVGFLEEIDETLKEDIENRE